MTRWTRRGKRLLWRVLGVGILMILVWLYLPTRGNSTVGGPRRVVIPRGATVRVVADSLASGRVISSPRLFRWYAAWGGRDRSIKPGTYQFSADMSWSAIVDALVSGRAIVHTITVPEGFSLREIVPLISRTFSVAEDSVRIAASDSAWRRKLDIPAKTLEGYLFPDTYTFADGVSAREVVNAMLEQFEQKWHADWNARLQAMSITRHAAVTMASIIETEARKPEERAVIGAVYWNRVRKGMKLQADPTVQYALPNHVDRVLFKDLLVNSPYNTYKYAGLPPGPIASPGTASLEAAINPASVAYLYFVAHPDGHHEFRTTFAEHQKAIALVKREAARLNTTKAPK